MNARLILRHLPLLRLLGVSLVVLAWLIPATGALAQELPTRDSLTSRLEALEPEEGTTPSEATQADIDALQAALEALDRLEAVREQREQLETRVREAPDELQRLQQELRSMEQSSQDETVEELEALSLEELQSRREEAGAELSRLQDKLANVSSRLLNAQTLPERAQQAISKAMQRQDEVRRRLAELGESQVAEDDPRRVHMRIERELAEQTLQLHQRELATNTRVRELDQEHRNLLERQVASQEARLTLLQGIIDRRQREQSEQAIAEAVSNEDGVVGHPVVTRAQEINRDMSLDLLQATERGNRMVREGLEVRRQLERVRQLQRSLNEQIDAIRGSILLSRILREQRQSLPRVEVRGELQDEIADLRLKQFELGRQRDQLRESEQLARQRLEEADAQSSPVLVESLLTLYQGRRELVDQLEQAYGEMLSAAIDLQLNQQQLLETSRELRTTIDEQLFWIANARPLDLAWLRSLPDKLLLEWQEGEWRGVLPVHWRVPDAGGLAGLPALLLATLLAFSRGRIKRRLARLHREVGHLKRDSQGHTPQAIGLNALLALPGPLGLLAVGIVLLLGGNGLAPRVGEALLHLALAWAVIAWARRLLVADGVATRHFYWPAGYAAALRRWLLWLAVALVPVLIISPLSRGAEIDLSQRPVALGLLFLGLIALSVVLAKLILSHTPFFGVKLFRLVLGLVMAMVPMVFVGLIASGYEYTALSLVGRFVITLYLLALWILVEATVVRGLAVAARRLAYRRALARRRAQVQEGAEGGLEVVEEPPLDMEQVNQQSLRLSKLILMIGFFVVLYLVWSDLFAVLGYLEQVTLLEPAPGEGPEVVDSMLSVADLFTALLVVLLTLMMARNLPGLLEVSVLSRLELKQGSAYAITSLLSYVIIGTGVVTALATLGVAWSQLQWLVAALGVGLGFGLQEIFANFVSGLIILFERPVRIGDTITLGNLTGTVSKIRIRATTVTDFDRKEIIIPNKTFVTDQLINWSLSDTITRVVLSYGVAYGSGHRLVHRLLRQAADENPRVLGDPEPQVFFMSYGESTLDFELRIFVNGLGDRLFATDEINCRVGELFAEHEVDIAFNQLDVWLHRPDGKAKRVESAPGGQVIDPAHPPPGAKGDPGDIDAGDAGR